MILIGPNRWAHAQPAAGAAKDFTKPAIVILGYGLNDNGTMRKMLLLLGLPDNRIIVEDKANSTVQNAAFSVPLAKDAGKTGIILVTSSTHQDRADGNFVDAGANVLVTVSYPDVDPAVNVFEFARDAMSPFINVG